MMMSQQRSSLLWQYAKRRPLVVTFAVACRCVWEVIPLTLPLLAGGLVNRLAETSSRSDPGGLPSVALIARSASVEGLIAALFGVAVLAGVLAIFKSLSMAHMGRGLVSYARRELSLAMLEADWGDTKRRSAGSWLTLLNSDCGHLRGLLERVFVRGVTSVLRFVGPLIGMLALSWEMAIGTLAVWPLAVVVIVYLHRAIRSAARAQSEAKDRYTHLVKETIDGAETIRGMGAERSWQRRLGDAIEAVEACQLRGATYSAGLQSVVWFTAIACLGVSWWMGAQRVTAGSMTVGGLVAFTGLLELAQRPIRSYTRIAQRFQRTTVSEERLRAAFDSLDVGRDSLCPETAKPNPSRNLVQSPAEPPTVRLESVKLTRGDRVLFDRFDHEFPAGKLTVLAGPSGVGKSSLLRMIGGLVSPDSGGILFRSVGPLDRSVNAAGSPAALEERERADDPRPPDDSRVRYPDFLVKTDSPVKTVFVPQQPWVLSGTLADNVRFGGGDPSPERLAWAAETSGVEKLVRDLPLGWETWIGDGVTELSGGQIQRVALCRALLREPTVLLLDEPTSALDVTAEAELLERLRGLRGRVTVILSAHRDACLREAEEVLWLPSGEDTARPVMKPGSGTVRENRSESARLREVPRGDSAKEAHHVASA